MGEDTKGKSVPRAEDIIAAFDRERAEARELHKRHTEHVRATRTNDRPARNE
jgi:hypothetical protein